MIATPLRFLLAFLAVIATPCRADEWLPPHPETYLSPDKINRVRVAPRPVATALSYFSDKVKNREPAGAPKGVQQTRAVATIEHLGSDGRWTASWSGPLTNEVAPAFALLSDGGDYLVTFDNWHSMGYGSNVVSILNGQGRLIRTLSLSDILSADYILALPHSVSSIWWRGEPRTAPGGVLVIPIVVPSDDYDRDNPTYVEAMLRLSDGAVISGASPEWQRAQAIASVVARHIRGFDEKARQAFIAPLLGPKNNTERDWHQYLNEAFLRSTPTWQQDFTSTTVLRDPADPEYAASESWMRDALLSLDHDHGAMSFASVAPFKHFVARMMAILVDARPGKLKGSKIYIAAPTGQLPMLRSIFAKTGAEVFVFDPARPIPQRRDRLERFMSRD